MKKLLIAALLLGASSTLSACSDDTGYVAVQPPYEEERTAGGVMTPAPQERVEVRTEEPVVVREQPQPVMPAQPVFELRVTK